jgi:hypothetical protein
VQGCYAKEQPVVEVALVKLKQQNMPRPIKFPAFCVLQAGKVLTAFESAPPSKLHEQVGLTVILLLPMII